MAIHRLQNMALRLALGAAVAALSGTASSEEVAPNCGLYTYRAYISRVIDGDTVVADIDLGFNTMRRNEHLRLIGINAPEPGSVGGQVSTDALRARIEHKELYICTIKAKRSAKEATGSFGRYLAEIYEGGENINRWMLRNGLAEAYDG